MTIGREGPQAAMPGWLRASDADRERVVDLLKAAFAEGLLTRDELGERVGRALTARTHADLAMSTLDIASGGAAAMPDDGAATPGAPRPVRPRRRPGALAKSGACALAALAMMLIDGALTGTGAGPMANGFYVLFIMAFVVAFVVWLCTLSAHPEDPATRQLPERPRRPAPDEHDQARWRAMTADPFRTPPRRE